MAFGLTACQTTDGAPSALAWGATAPPVAAAKISGALPANGDNGELLLANAHGGPSTIIEGSGRFIGEPPTGTISRETEADSGGVTLNLVNVPAPQAAKTILGDILAVKYTVDPGIEGKITIQTPKPVSRTAVIDLFQSALRANNAAIINTNGIYRIASIDQAAVGGSFRADDSPDPEMIGSGLQIVQLKYVAASEMRHVLEPIAPHGGIVRTDDARNEITLSGNRQDIAVMMDAIALFDVDTMKGKSFAIVPVKTSQPDAIAGELKTVFGSDREGPMAGMVRFLPNRRLSAILVISPQAQYLRRAETWIRRLDAQAEGNEKQLFTYSVQNRQAQDLVEVLQSMFSNDAAADAGKRNVAPNYQEASLKSSAPPSLPGSTGSLGIGADTAGNKGRLPPSAMPARASPTGTSVQLGADSDTEGPRVKIVADETKNAILIEATKADYRRILRAITKLDQMPNQVLIEATIAEVTLNDDLQFGVQWYLQKKSGNYTFSSATSGAINSVFPGFSYAMTAANAASTLDALNQVTQVNIVSSPSLTVLDNKPAVLQIGDQVPITTQSATSVLTAGAPIVNSVTYKDTGVILSITPRINQSGRVLLDIEQEVSSVVPTTSSGIDSPTIRQRKIKTSVVVNDRDTLVLGGLMQDSRTVTRSQIPILGDIPLIGNAVGNKDNAIVKTELIILIRPHVIRNLDEARQITDEYRQYMGVEGPHRRSQSSTIEDTGRRILN
jgi:general secretion pathway protein D